jgi:hypothetical protein
MLTKILLNIGSVKLGANEGGTVFVGAKDYLSVYSVFTV